MSRKKSKHRQAVPEEILAEGSGPVATAEPEAAVEVTAAEEPVADKPAGKKKGGKKAKSAETAETPETPEMVEDEIVATEAAEEVAAVEVASEPEELAPVGRRKRGKQRGKTVEAAADATDGEASEGDANLGEDAGSEDVLEASNEIDAVEASSEPMDDVAIEASAEDANEMVDASGEIETSSEVSNEELAALTGEAASSELAADASGDASGDASEQTGDDVVGDPITDEAGVEAALLPGTLSPVQLRHLIEALIFATDKPVTLQRLRQLTRVSDVKRIEQALAELQLDYKDRGIALQQVSGGYQFRTNTAFSSWVQQLIAGRPVRLSRAQLETLAIVAYRQPITRPEIDEIRGVDSSATLRLLLERSLIRVLGKREEVGRPVLYGTTKEFLDFFSLGDLRELPTLREYSELTAESRQVMSDRLGVPLDENGEPIESDSLDDDGMLRTDGEPDQASLVDSILAEHAAAEAEADARHDARMDASALADAALAGGTSVAMRDIFRDDPDLDAMELSGELSPTGAEARSYVDAIRQSALADDEVEAPLPAPDDTIARETELVSEDMTAASTDVADASTELEAASEDLLAASEKLAAVVADEVAVADEHVAEAAADLEPMEAGLPEPSDESEMSAAPHVGHEPASNESEMSAAPHVSDELDEANEMAAHGEPASSSDESEMTAAPGVGHESVSDESEMSAAPHVGHEPASDESEMSAAPHAGHEPASDESEMSAAPHAGHEPASDESEMIAPPREAESEDPDLMGAAHVGHAADSASEADLMAMPHEGHADEERSELHSSVIAAGGAESVSDSDAVAASEAVSASEAEAVSASEAEPEAASEVSFDLDGAAADSPSDEAASELEPAMQVDLASESAPEARIDAPGDDEALDADEEARDRTDSDDPSTTN